MRTQEETKKSRWNGLGLRENKQGVSLERQGVGGDYEGRRKTDDCKIEYRPSSEKAMRREEEGQERGRPREIKTLVLKESAGRRRINNWGVSSLSILNPRLVEARRRKRSSDTTWASYPT